MGNLLTSEPAAPRRSIVRALVSRVRMFTPQVEAASHEPGPPDRKESFIERHFRAPYLNGILNGKHLPALYGSFLQHADFNNRFTPRQATHWAAQRLRGRSLAAAGRHGWKL